MRSEQALSLLSLRIEPSRETHMSNPYEPGTPNHTAHELMAADYRARMKYAADNAVKNSEIGGRVNAEHIARAREQAGKEAHRRLYGDGHESVTNRLVHNGSPLNKHVKIDSLFARAKASVMKHPKVAIGVGVAGAGLYGGLRYRNRNK